MCGFSHNPRIYKKDNRGLSGQKRTITLCLANWKSSVERFLYQLNRSSFTLEKSRSPDFNISLIISITFLQGGVK